MADTKLTQAHNTHSLLSLCTTFPRTDGTMGCLPDSASNLKPDNLIGVKDEKYGEEGSEGQDGMTKKRKIKEV